MQEYAKEIVEPGEVQQPDEERLENEDLNKPTLTKSLTITYFVSNLTGCS